MVCWSVLFFLSHLDRFLPNVMQEDRENILRARATGKAVLTSPFRLLGSHHLGVVLTFPVYKSKLSSKPTEEERIQATAGSVWICSFIRNVNSYVIYFLIIKYRKHIITCQILSVVLNMGSFFFSLWDVLHYDYITLYSLFYLVNSQGVLCTFSYFDLLNTVKASFLLALYCLWLVWLGSRILIKT